MAFDIFVNYRAVDAASGPLPRTSCWLSDYARGTKIHRHPATYRAWATAVARYGFETYDMFTEHPSGADLRESV